MSKHYTVTVYPHAVVVKRTEDSKPTILFCPFRQEDDRYHDNPLGGISPISGACGPDCPHFGNTEYIGDGSALIRLTCGFCATLETAANNLRWIKEQ